MSGAILIIDDDKETTDRLVRFLNKEGFASAGVYSGDEGIEYLKNHPIDIVVTDMNMRGASGLDVLKSAKDVNPDTDVVMISGYPSVEAAVETMKQGAYDYIQKPINAEELLILLQRCLEKKNLAKELDGERKLRQQLEEMNRELKTTQEQLIQSEKLATIGEMAAGVAHEINNPLTSVTMNLAALADTFDKLSKEGGVSGPDQNNMKGKLAIIESEIDRTAKIVKSLLKLSRKSDDEERTLVHMSEVIDKTLDPIAHQLELANITLERKYDPEIPPVKVNVNHMQQVFLNLISNARDALNERDGLKNIIISTERKTDDAFPGKKFVTITVRDTGPGIPEETLKKIFTPFFTTKETGKGTGLGLSITSRIVAQHGGKISVESTPGKGTAFTVAIPI